MKNGDKDHTNKRDKKCIDKHNANRHAKQIIRVL